jgi:hypothetical protein
LPARTASTSQYALKILLRGVSFCAAVDAKTVRPVAEAAGSAAAAGLNTTIFAEAVAAAYFTGGVPNEAMTEAFRKAAQTGGCKGVIQVLERELAGDRAATGHAVNSEGGS